jgi:NDP-sugar pyrophosphorylase family protein
MSKKYEFTGETRVVVYKKSGDFVNVNLKRIRALRDFGDVRTGDLGGWIEKEDNLSQEGKCWVYHNAIAAGNSKISGGACIKDNAQIFDNIKISEMAIISGEARISGDSIISGTTHVSINACIFDSEEYQSARTLFKIGES